MSVRAARIRNVDRNPKPSPRLEPVKTEHIQKVLRLPEGKLEHDLETAFWRVGATGQSEKDTQKECLLLLYLKHPRTYGHSVRVGLLGAKAAAVLGLDPKELMFCGLDHDVGKIKMRIELLRKTGRFTEADRAEMRRHPEGSADVLTVLGLTFEAQVSLLHHSIQKHGYPEGILKGASEKAVQYAIAVALLDFYDSATTRKGTWGGEMRLLKPEEAEAEMLKAFPGLEKTIELLFDKDKGVLGKAEAHR